MRKLIKIIVTDSAGEEHIFNQECGVVENYLELRPMTVHDEPLSGYVEVTTRIFSDREIADTETVTLFISPRRVDAIYGYE
jgi:hypothetical protein